MAVRTTTDRIIQRINTRLSVVSSASDAERKEALFRVGLLVQNEAKLNIRRHRLIDTGRLINSIQFKLVDKTFGQSVLVGSFGVPYAKVHEYGFAGNVDVKNHTRTINQAFGKPIAPTQVEVRAHSRYQRIRARPYLRPALAKMRRQIMQIIRSIGNE
jgi:phage gpG-like protein